jgi:hypothetical protein
MVGTFFPDSPLCFLIASSGSPHCFPGFREGKEDLKRKIQGSSRTGFITLYK